MTTVAIDFGTTNTIVAMLDPITGQPHTLKLGKLCRRLGDMEIIPSLVFVDQDHVCRCGQQVRSQRLGAVNPQRLFQGFKRELVSEFRSPPVQLETTAYSAEEIATRFIGTIWQEILQQCEPTQVIFTAPVGAFEQYLVWFNSLKVTLNLPNLRVIDESTAAALGYAVGAAGQLVLVLDLGGGTLDLSLVRLGEQRAEVIAKADAYVGGMDIDMWIAAYFLKKWGRARADIDGVGWLNLLEICEVLKMRLSELAEVRTSWFDDQGCMAWELALNQGELAEILEEGQLIEQMRQCLDEVVAIAYGKGVSKSQIDQVLLVGGSSQIKPVQDLVISYFGKTRVKLDNPLGAIAFGALRLGNLTSLDDHLHHSYALRLWDQFTKSYYYYPIFTKGTKYPCKRSLILQVATPDQTEIRIEVGELTDSQGEVAYDHQGRMLSGQSQGKFTALPNPWLFKLKPPGTMGMDRLELDCSINRDRLLTIAARDLLTQKFLPSQQSQSLKQ